MNSSYKMRVVWPNVMGWIIAHAFGVYGASFLPHVKKETLVFTLISLWMTAMVIWVNKFLNHFLLHSCLMQGVTAGVHRLWSHRSYKATPLLRVFLIFCQTLAGESSIYIWVRDHRTHHKGSDTDADPYNASRGFFFSHVSHGDQFSRAIFSDIWGSNILFAILWALLFKFKNGELEMF